MAKASKKVKKQPEVMSEPEVVTTDKSGTSGPNEGEFFSRGRENRREFRDEIRNEIRSARENRKRNWGARIFWSCMFISAGLLLLLNNFGLVSWSAWLTLLQFWPVMLILIGVELVFGKSFLGRIIVIVLTLITFVVVGLAVVLSSTGALHDKLVSLLPQNFVNIFDRKSEQARMEITEAKTGTYSDVKSRELNINLSAGELNLVDDDSNNLLSGEILYDAGREQPKVNVSKVGDKASLTVDMDSKFTSFNWFSGLKRQYNLNLGAADLSTDIKLDLSAGSANIDLDKVKVSSLTIDQSAGSSEAKLTYDTYLFGQKYDYHISAGSAKLKLAGGVHLTVNYNVSAGSVNIKGKDYYGNGTYSDPEPQMYIGYVTVNVDVSAGSFEVN